MNNIKAVIVEDEKKGMEKLVALLKEYCPNVEIIGKYYDGVTAIKGIKKEHPDLVFLDLHIVDMNGFDVKEETEYLEYETIITTAHDEYGIKAIRNEVTDYLLKPYTKDELITAVNKAWSKIIEKTQKNVTKVKLPTTHGVRLVDIKDIVYCESDDNYSKVHLMDKEEIYLSKTLGKLYKEILPQTKFCRISRQIIINMNLLESYSKIDGGSIILTTGDSFLTNVGVYRKDLLDRLAKI